MVCKNLPLPPDLNIKFSDMQLYLIFLLIFIFATPPSYSQKADITGRLVDLVTGEPLSRVEVSVNTFPDDDPNNELLPANPTGGQKTQVTFSDDEGYFSLSGEVPPNPPGRLFFRKEGYMEKTVDITFSRTAPMACSEHSTSSSLSRNPGEIALKPDDYIWRTGKVFRWQKYDDNPSLMVEEALEAGLNMISVMDRYFTQGAADNRRLIKLAEEAGIKVFIIFQTFYNDDATIDKSNSALDREGNMVKDSWLSFICPNEEGYKRKRLQDIEDLVALIRPHGISMDFFRFFVYWEAGSDGNRPQTCFCHRCLEKFGIQYNITGSAEYILSAHTDTWTDFKCRTINEFAALIHGKVKAIDPRILLNLHMVPWKQDDYEGAIKRIAAQDIVTLSRYFDFLQPMTYSTMLDESIEWIHEMGADAAGHVKDTYIIPCIQAADAGPENFSIIMKPPVSGYSIWPFERYFE